MSTKEKLIEKISTIEDPELLLEIDRWITTLIEATVQETYSREEIAAVREGYRQYQSGKTITQKEASELFDQWLKEK
jgi:predicted transcriptional regulator